MVNPDEVERSLNEHFEQVSLEQFRERYDEYVGEADSSHLPMEYVDETFDVLLHQREAAPLELKAYLASALTGLSPVDREHIFAVSDVVAEVCRQLNIELYEPRNFTDPVQHTDVSAEEVFSRDREVVLGSDLVIHIADFSSTGAGEELEFAQNALIPIVLLSRGDSVVSRMVLGIPAMKLVIDYDTLEELQAELNRRLTEVRPILEERKLAFSEFDRNIVGNKVRLLREEARISRETLANSSPNPLTTERLRVIEESTDRVANPSLVELRTLATILKTTVADLVEPDLQERVIVMLNEWLDGSSAARFAMSHNDRNRIITRILLRVIDSLQSEQ